VATRRHFFYNKQGQRLAANLDLPESDSPHLFALYAHCFTCSKNLKSIVHISRVLTEMGIAVFRFDFTGLADSEGEFSSTTLSQQIDDVLAAARFLAENFVSASLLIGHSLGGSAMQAAAAQIPSARGLVLIATPDHPNHVGHLLADTRQQALEDGEAEVSIGGNRFKLKAEFFKDLDSHLPPSIEDPLQLLIVHSPQDEIVPIEHAFRLFSRTRTAKSLISLDGADHILSRTSDAIYAGQMIGRWAIHLMGG
jgi:putative redox protein